MQTTRNHTNLSQFLFLLGRTCIFTFLFSFAFSSFGQTNEGQPFVLSSRVGLDIDSMEVEYFNIFPDLNGVKSVVYRKDNLENMQMLVSLANGQDTTLIFSKLATIELSKYIDKHEILRDSSSIVNWDLLPGYGLSKMNYFEDYGSLLIVQLKDSTVQAGKLMKMTANGILLWQGKQPTRSNLFPDLIKPIQWNEIMKIQVKQDLSGKIFGISMGVGLGIALSNILFLGSLQPDAQDLTNTLVAIGVGGLIGTSIGLLYDYSTVSRRKFNFESPKFDLQKIKMKLSKRSIFDKVYPPELKVILEGL